MFFKRMKNIDVEAICSCFDTLLHIASMIAYKVISMTFPYIATLMLLQLLMKHFHDFSIIDIPSMDHQTCQTSMWHNILYIDQFYPLEQRVCIHTIKKWFDCERVFCLINFHRLPSPFHVRLVQCMVWSWILSVEVHCFIVACIILLILKNHPRFGIIIFSSILISSLIANTALRIHEHQPEKRLNSRYILD